MTVREWHWRFLSYAFLAAVVAVTVATVGHYGITWDEEYHKEYGAALLRWYSSLGADQDAVGQWHIYLYGGFFDTVAQLVADRAQSGVYETRHAVNLAFGLLGILATYRMGLHLGGAAAGFFSALFLALTPVYYGHMFNNPKDIPFAALVAVSLLFVVQSLDSLPRVPTRRVVQLGVAIGLASAMRVVGGALLGYLALVWAGWLLGQWRAGLAPALRNVGRALRDLGPRFLAVALLAWLVMLLWWPWALISPILHPYQALRDFTGAFWPLTVLFEGRFVKATELPPGYLPTWLAITLPEFYFVALLAGVALAGRFLLGFRGAPSQVVSLLRVGLLLMAVLVPILSAMLLHSSLYDAYRQFLFVLPPLAVLAGASIAGLLTSRGMLAARLAVAGAVFLSAGLAVYDMGKLHPYQYVYFNRLVAGGLETAASRFETDYYGASYREGIGWLVDNYRSPSGERVRVANSSMGFLTAYYLEASPELRKRFQPVQAWEDPHIYLSTTRWDYHKDKEGKLLHVVARQGVPLLYVIEVRPAG